MKIIFWENIVSQHKLPYWNYIANSNRVSKFILVVEEVLSQEHKQQGWGVDFDNSAKFELRIKPSEEEIRSILEENIENSYHVFSGIRSVPLIYKSLILSKNYSINRILLTETVNLNGIRSITRRFASLFIERKYLKYFDIVLGSGASTKNWYQECGVKSECFYPFLYSVAYPEKQYSNWTKNASVKFVFIGQLIKRKGLDILIDALGKMKDDNWLLDVYGKGVDEQLFREQVIHFNLGDRINFKGVTSNEVLQKHLSEYYTLILPSRFDGWGAVVNEAIGSGLKVICSDRCGASVLLIDKKIGSVFKINKTLELTKLLQESIENVNSYDKNYILNYSSYLKGDCVAEYFLDILEHNYKKKGLRPISPWDKFIQELV